MKKVLSVVAVALSLGTACDLNPLERGEEAEVAVRTTKCQLDRQTLLVRATYEATSEKEYQSVLFRGEVIQTDGTVIATGSGSITSMRPGRTYRQTMVMSTLSEPPEGDIECEVTLDFATEPFG
jgi:hypothetical protein